VKFLDPAQPGQIIAVRIAQAIIDVHLNPREQFSRLFMFEYANENARTLCLSAFRDASDLTAPSAIN
jgi:hypothetical protein